MKNDLIRRQDAIDALLKGKIDENESLVECPTECNAMIDGAIEDIKALPSAHQWIPVTRKKGKWIKVLEADETGNATYECPFCHRGEVHCPIVEVKFCWNCGAEMEGEDDAEVH